MTSTTNTSPTPGFEIPAKYATQLTFSPSADTRTDEELLATLDHAPPVTSEKNIWAFWHSTVRSMPDWTRRNILAWMRINPGWTVRVLDQVPSSPNYALNFIPSEMLPKTFVEGTMVGDVKAQHASDFVRGAVLYLHGGIYMDVGSILFRSLDRVCWDDLVKGPKTVACPVYYGQSLANFFIAARKGDEFVKQWHNLFMHVWKDRTSPSGLIADPLWAPLIPSLTKKLGADTRYAWDWKVEFTEVFEYVTQGMCWMRLCHIQEPGPDGFDGATYWKEKILVWDALSEHLPIEERLGFAKHPRFIDLMAIKRDDTQNPDWAEARTLVFDLLSQSVMQKVTHAKGLTHSIALGVLLDSPEHDGADIEPGTFFELLRYGAVNFKQTREHVKFIENESPTDIIHKGAQEP